ncbi:phosphatidylinositol-specific phospholipase C [Chryseobacterium populi]|uniref:1-phosphatidylinositol phosphodiesterase n=1 Tax=Chryseobacterium populi TaxID=1144316 RepID=J3CB98_9FLAO|nr:phosphatidylinositol-specific phospholipase C [Chryseobacterium populi]EJL68001.1 phosphatidylinositol-specific phospholipase C-like protein [Chryseobacterium populi]
MKTFTQNWMSHLNGSKKLSELTIPGTHDSGAYNTGLAAAKCQTMSFTEQLNAGIRFLDVRLKRGYDADKDHVLWVYHGIVDMDISFNGSVLGFCRQFLSENSSETIIMSVKNESSPKGDSDKDKFYNDFMIAISQFPELFYTENRIPTLDEVRGKIVLVRRFGLGTKPSIGLDLYDNWPEDSCGYFQNYRITYYVQDVYYSWSKGTDKANKFNEYVKNGLIAASGGDPQTLFFNFTSATGITGGVLPFSSTPQDLAEVVNPLFFQYLKNHSKGRYGIIPMDFPNNYPDNSQLIQSIISCNELNVVTAV